MAGRGIHLVERAVHPVADLELCLERLEMDVARARGDRLVEDQVDEANDRCGIGFLRDHLRVELILADLVEGDLRILAELGEDVLHGRGFGTIVLRNERADSGGWRDHDVNFAIESETKVFRDLRVERVDQGHINGVVGMPDRKRPVKTGETTRNKMQDVRSAVEHIEIDNFRSERLGDQREELVFGDDAMVHHHILDRLAGGGCLLRERMALIGAQPAGFDEHISDLLRIHTHSTSVMVVVMTSSAVVIPASTLRTPSSRSVRMPSSRARLLSWIVDAPLMIMWRTSSSIMNNSKMPMRPLKPLPRQFSQPCAFWTDALGDLFRIDAQAFRFVNGQFTRLFAVRAQPADQPLRKNRAHRTRDEKRLDADIHQTRDGAGRVVRVQRRKNEVAGQAGVDGDARRSRDHESHRS